MRGPRNTGEHSGTNKKPPTSINIISFIMGELGVIVPHETSEVLHLSSDKANHRGGQDLYISISKTAVEIRKKSVSDTQVLEFLKSLCLPIWTWLLIGEV